MEPWCDLVMTCTRQPCAFFREGARVRIWRRPRSQGQTAMVLESVLAGPRPSPGALDP